MATFFQGLGTVSGQKKIADQAKQKQQAQTTQKVNSVVNKLGTTGTQTLANKVQTATVNKTLPVTQPQVNTTKFPTYDLRELVGVKNTGNQISYLNNVAKANQLQQTNNNIQGPQIVQKQNFSDIQDYNNYQLENKQYVKNQKFMDLYNTVNNGINNGQNILQIKNQLPEYQNSNVVNNLYADIIKNNNNGNKWSELDFLDQYSKYYKDMFQSNATDLNSNAELMNNELLDHLVNTKLSDVQYNKLSEGGKAMYDFAQLTKSYADSIRNQYYVDSSLGDWDIVSQRGQADPEGFNEAFGDILKNATALNNGDEIRLGLDNNKLGKLAIGFDDMLTQARNIVNQALTSDKAYQVNSNGEYVNNNFLDRVYRAGSTAINMGVSGITNLAEGGSSLISDKGASLLIDMANKIEDANINKEEKLQQLKTTKYSDMENLIQAGIGAFDLSIAKSPIGSALVGAMSEVKPLAKGFERVGKQVDTVLNKIPALQTVYNDLDPERQEQATQLISGLLTVGILKAVGGSQPVRYVKDLNSSVRKSVKAGLQGAKEESSFQRNVVEQGMGNRREVIDPVTGEVTTEFESYSKGANKRVAESAVQGFKEGFNAEWNRQRNPIDINNKLEEKPIDNTNKSNNTPKDTPAPDNRTTVQKVSETAGKIVKGVNEGATTVKDTVIDTVNNIKNWKNATIDDLNAYIKENIVEPYKKGRGTNLNNKGVQDIKVQGQLQEKRSGLGDISKTESNIIKNNEKIKDDWRIKQLENYNRMNKGDIDKFEKRYKVSYGQRMANRGFIKSGEENLQSIRDYKDNLKNLKTEVLSKIKQKYQDEQVTSMINDVVERAEYTGDKELEKILRLQKEYNQGGLTPEDIDRIRYWYGDHIRTGFYKEQNSKETERADNIYYGVKDFLEKVSSENGFDQLKELNKEIASAMHIINGVEKRANGVGANRAITLTDIQVLAGAMANPKSRPLFAVKLAMKNPKIRDVLLKSIIKGKDINTFEKIKADFEKIKDIQNQAKQEQFMKEFADKYLKDIPLALEYNPNANDLGGGTIDTRPITTTPEGQSVRKGQIQEIDKRPENQKKGLSNTAKEKVETKSTGLSETAKTTEKPKVVPQAKVESEPNKVETEQVQATNPKQEFEDIVKRMVEIKKEHDKYKEEYGLSKYKGENTISKINGFLKEYPKSSELSNEFAKLQKKAHDLQRGTVTKGGSDSIIGVANGLGNILEGGLGSDVAKEILNKYGIKSIDTYGLYETKPNIKDDTIQKTGQTEKYDYNSKNDLISKNNTDGLGNIKETASSGVQGANKELSNAEKLSGEQMNDTRRSSGSSNTEQSVNVSPITEQGSRSENVTRSSQRLNNKKAKELLEDKNFSIKASDYTQEELAVLKDYEGAGGLTNKGEDTTGVQDQFYTPQKIVNKVRGLVDKYRNNVQGKPSMLETSTGTGRFFRDGYDITGYEIDKYPGTIAQILNPSAKVVIDDFQNLFMDFTKKRPQAYNGNKFDVVIGNPPYKQRITPQRTNGEEPKIDRFEDYFVKKAVDVANDGGIVAMVLPSTFLNKKSNYAKDQILKDATIVDAYRLPEGVFPNTQVGTDILILKKDMSGSKAINDGQRFKDHPEKILGVEKTRISRRGKEETYVDGGENPLSQLDKILTDNTEVKEITQQKTGIQRQKDTSIAGRFTNKILDIIESNGGLDTNGYLKVEAPGFEPLSIEELGGGKLAVSQTYIQNGDVMFDPEIVFGIDDNGKLVAETYRQDGLGIYQEAKPNDPFLDTWTATLDEFVKRTPEEQAQEYVEKITQTEKTIENKIQTKKDEPQGLSTMSKPKTERKPRTKKAPTETIITGTKDDIESKVIAVGEVSDKILNYQAKVNVDGYIEGVDPETDIENLNYYMGHTQLNDLYFAGNVYDKLDQLEIDKSKMSEELYNKQKKGLKEVLPTKYTIDDIVFDPLDKTLMETKTSNLHEETTWEEGIREKRNVNNTIEYEFFAYLRQLPYGSGLSTWEAQKYLRGQKMDKKTKNETMEQTKNFFNKYLREELDKDTKEILVNNYNRNLRSYVRPKYEEIPLALEGISKTFRGNSLKLSDGQIRGINFLLSKGAGLVAHGVGHGKTMEGIIATVNAMNRGWTKKPLFIVPAPTLNSAWIDTIKEIYPDKEIVNLGGLTSKDIDRLKKDLGNDPRNWIKEGQLAIITHDGFSNKIGFKQNTEMELMSDLQDVMGSESDNVKQQEKLRDKVKSIMTGATKAVGDTSKLSLDDDFLGTWYNNMFDMGYDEFVKKFSDSIMENFGKDETFAKEQADLMRGLKPILIEDLGIDHLTVDEAHNMKNIFSKAKMKEEDENGNKEINRFGDVTGSSSAIGRKMYLASQYILRNNNNRNVFLLTATPFNNQPIEVYNMLSLMGRKRLQDLGIQNINDFFTKFANFKEDLVAKPSGTDFDTKRVMKSFANLQEMQRLVNEFVDYLGDRPDLIKPKKILKKVVLRMSEKQSEIQEQLEELVNEKKEMGDVLKGMTKMRLNLISPYLVNGESPTVDEFIQNSPKLEFATKMIKELRDMGKQDGVFIYMPFGTEFHGMFKEGIAKYAGVDPEKIGIINGNITKEQKDKVAEQFRKGEINVLIGGSNTVEGIDLQNNGYITYNVLQGWNPTEITQLNGRVRRQGNFNNEVLEVLPLLENSADIVMMQKREEKEARINNIFEYQGTVFDTGELDPQEEKLALLTNPYKKADVYMNLEGKKIDKLKQSETLKLSELNKLKDKEKQIKEISHYEEELQKAKDKQDKWYTEYYQDLLKQAKTAERRYNEKKARMQIEDIDTAINESKTAIEMYEKQKKELEDSKDAVIEKFKQESLDQKANMKTMDQYLEDLKVSFKNAHRFGSKTELENWLMTKNKVEGLSDMSNNTVQEPQGLGGLSIDQIKKDAVQRGLADISEQPF